MAKKVHCAIAGGGPAGLMLGVLLARAGLSVVVLERHRDFLRDFRGDTIHPSTLDIMNELGWLDEFLKLPHQRVGRLFAQFGQHRLALADFAHLPVAAPFIAMMPQWDFLDFLAAKGRTYPGFDLRMEAEATGLLETDGRVTGLTFDTASGRETIESDLVIAADGRASRIKQAAGLDCESFGAPMDVLWFRLPRHATDTVETQGRFDAGRVFIMLNRGDYWQCAFVIAKDTNEIIRGAGLDAFQASVAAIVPFEAARVEAITDWDQVKLLTVLVNRLKTWARPGLLAIGDAAHAMSPVGGVGVNLAVQDAVAAANLLARPLLEKRLTFDDLRRVQKRRSWPTRVIQRLQLTMQDAVIAPALAAGTGRAIKPPLALRAVTVLPFLRRIPARIIGLGIRREHVADFIRRS